MKENENTKCSEVNNEETQIKARATIKLIVSDIMANTIKLEGDFKVRSMILDDEKLAKILKEHSKNLEKLNKDLAEYLINME